MAPIAYRSNISRLTLRYHSDRNKREEGEWVKFPSICLRTMNISLFCNIAPISQPCRLFVTRSSDVIFVFAS